MLKTYKEILNKMTNNSWYAIEIRVIANGPGDRRSIPGRVIPKTQKMVFDATLLNTQHYKVCIKGKVEQSRERSSTHPLQLVVVAIEKGAFRSPSTMVANNICKIRIWHCHETQPNQIIYI